MRATRWLSRLLPARVPTFLYEITPRCDLDCRYCYNVWKLPDATEPRELTTAEAREALSRMLRLTRARTVAVTGGEPLLRDDLEAIVSHLAHLRARVTLITNGRRLDRKRTRALIAAGVTTFEIPLHSHEPAVHDRLVRGRGHARALEAIASVRVEGGATVGVIVLTRENAADVEPTLTLLAAAGVDAVMLNRFNPGGEGLRHLDALTPSRDQLAAAFDVADRLGRAHDLPIACSVPVPPCELDTSLWSHLSFGACPVGTNAAYPCLGPDGRVRPCNHSPLDLGDPFDRGFPLPTGDAGLPTPERCRECADLSTCRGGCPAAAGLLAAKGAECASCSSC